MNSNTPNPTGTEAAVCLDIAGRQAHGIAKYGTTVADNPLPLRDWLQHAYEECLDQAVYLKRAISACGSPPAAAIVKGVCTTETEAPRCIHTLIHAISQAEQDLPPNSGIVILAAIEDGRNDIAIEVATNLTPDSALTVVTQFLASGPTFKDGAPQ